MLHDIGIKPLARPTPPLQSLVDAASYADASAAWELTYKAQMAEAGLHVQTVGEGIAILLQAVNELNAWNKRICDEEN
jgi:hypothetical protein